MNSNFIEHVIIEPSVLLQEVSDKESKEQLRLLLGAVSTREFPAWYRITKVLFDYVFSIISVLLLLPVIIILAFIIKLSDGGPVLHTQDRIGKNGKQFRIYKFRSMTRNAEQGIPELSFRNDPRITRIGLFMRRYRLDEIPNFINVLKGDISVVGPRPERLFYIEQIIEIAPVYSSLQRIKPGITSWGQVKYGYASNVEEMIERMHFDLYYLVRRGPLFDLRILLHTIVTISGGKGT